MGAPSCPCRLHWPSNQSPSFSAKQNPLPMDGDDGDRKSCSLFLLLLRRRRKYWIRKQNQSRAHCIHPSPLSFPFTQYSLECLLKLLLCEEARNTQPMRARFALQPRDYLTCSSPHSSWRRTHSTAVVASEGDVLLCKRLARFVAKRSRIASGPTDWNAQKQKSDPCPFLPSFLLRARPFCFSGNLVLFSEMPSSSSSSLFPRSPIFSTFQLCRF